MNKKVFHTEGKDPNISPIYPQVPFRMNIAGSSGCGKTNFLLNLLTDPKMKVFDYIFLFCRIDQPKYKILEEYCKENDIEFYISFELPDEDLMEKIKSDEELRKAQKLFIIDDMMHESACSKVVNDCFTVFSHHMNISIITINQRIFINNSKTQRLNTEYYVLFNVNTDVTQPRILFQQLEGKGSTKIFEIYRKCVEKPFSYFFIDLKCHNKQNLKHLKYRNNSLNDVILLDEE